MLQRTKSANKAVIAEARNSRDTADTLAGREQCDEDDYGYESSIAQKFYEKLVTKYEANPVDPMDKFTKSGNLKKSNAKELGQTVERVKASLTQGEDAAKSSARSSSSRGPRGSSQKPTATSTAALIPKPTGDDTAKRKRTSEEEARRKRRALAAKVPPPPSFEDLMKIAKEKSKEPVKVDKSKVVKEAEFGRPMTKKEKDDYLRERNSYLRKIGKLPRSSENTNPAHGKSQTTSGTSPGSESPHSNSKSKPSTSVNKPAPAPEPPKKPVIVGPEFHPAVLKAKKVEAKIAKTIAPPPAKRPKVQAHRSRSPSPIRPARSQLQQRLERGRPNRIESESEGEPLDDDEEDEDSEMDDFIDDSDSKMDVSSMIGAIFGYDRNRYRDEEPFDDRAMENNRFSEVMKEEARSARIGLQEDLEDMRMEEEEKKRKRMMMKKRKR